ncbi:hypothetical protein HYT53_02915 [Candidatus Woesearchaeota archaeon]|nr:hypothetical protein [Candidatus Woesearchaeota archaeon]
MQNKAQGGMNAAVLVAIIAGLIILYIVFLPSGEREKLIEKKQPEPALGESPNILLQASPGALSTSRSMESEKKIPNIFLVETTNAKDLEKINPFIVRNGWFDKKTRNIDFVIEDIDNTDNVVLSFAAKKRKGVLEIKLNNVIVFENEIASEIVEPVKLDKKLLMKQNSLEFSVSSVGARFWTTNEYSFENIRIIGDITDTSRQESTNLFVLSDPEFASMEKATLKFVPYCGNVNQLGTLDIFINNKKLFSSVPKCNDAYRQSIPKSALNQGENNVVFKTSKGSYSVEQIGIALEFNDASSRTYYFEVKPATFTQIRDGDVNIEVTLKFTDSQKKKRIKMDINGHIDTVETDKMSFTKNINGRVSEGNNFVRLEPLEDIEVAELRVRLA